MRHAPYEIPFPHVGIGQDDDWVRANFTNATDILAVGYADWVDAQVGVDLTNGLYKFTATFPDDPPESTELVVGDKSVCVTNAGEYVFVLEKGVEYSFGTNPYDPTVEYSVQDDLMDAPVFANGWWGDDNGVWTIDGGWQWISTPTIWGFGYCMWLSKFHGSPDVAHLGVDDFPMTFEAVLTDCCRTNGVTYHWSTSTEGVRILSPNSRVTQVTVDALPSWDRFSLTVDAYSPGETLTSTITTTYGTNATPQVSFGLSIPEVMFVNDDDDDDNGVPSFPVVVVPVHLIGIHAMIIRRGAFQPTDRDRIDMMIRTANDIYAQVGMRFYIASISTTNLPAAYDIVPSSVTNDIGNVWRHSQLAALRSGTGGIECYFVNRILNGKGEDSHIRGLSSKSGIALSSHAVSKTLAHEIGHLCGAEDVYDTNEYGTEPIMGHVCLEKSAEDWNGGCNGRGEAGTRYYSHGLSMRTVIGRLLMNGLSGGEDVRRDITIGSVDGYHEAMPPETTEFVITNGTAAVGFEYGGIFKLPICN